jgi:hypothetical protein
MAWFDKAKDAGSIARQRLNARAGMPSTPTPAASAGRGLGFNPLLGAYAIPGFGEQKAQNRLDVMQMAAGPLNELRYIGSELMQRRLPYTAPAQQAQQTGMYGRYASPSAQVSTPSASPSPAAERAYQQEASRVAQLTAQDPELQRYERARAGAKTQEEMNAARDIGMQIWAQRHGGLAANVKPGQSGYDAIQGTINAGAMGQPTEMGAFAGAQPSSLLFNPSNPLATAPPTGPVDYTTVAPSAFTGATGLGAESSYFGGSANQQQAKMFTRFQDAAPGGTPLQTGMNALLAPGSVPAPMASYQGAQGFSPVGTSLTPDANAYASSLASDKAQAQAEEFKKKLLSAQAK